jgi:hypothetical protein
MDNPSRRGRRRSKSAAEMALRGLQAGREGAFLPRPLRSPAGSSGAAGGSNNVAIGTPSALASSSSGASGPLQKTPLHNWGSAGADAFRYFAVATCEPRLTKPPRFQIPQSAGNWMAGG